VILAGGRLGPEWVDVPQAGSLEYRSELPFAGRTMLDVVADALTPTVGLGRLVVVGGPSGRRTVEAGDTFIESLRRGLAQVETERFLLATADLPFLTAADVAAFLAACDPEAMLNYPVVPAHLCDEAYPGLPRTTLRLREGRFTGGNLGLIRAGLMRGELGRLERAYGLRKRPLALAAMVGWGTLARVALGQMMPSFAPIAPLEASVSRLLGAPVRGVVVDRAAVGADVDTPDQYRRALRLAAASG